LRGRSAPLRRPGRCRNHSAARKHGGAANGIQDRERGDTIMRALCRHGKLDVRIGTVPDPTIGEPAARDRDGDHSTDRSKQPKRKSSQAGADYRNDWAPRTFLNSGRRAGEIPFAVK
jgi:hypothetical protein